MSELDISGDFIGTVVPRLKDEEELYRVHDIVKESNPSLHLIHKLVVGSLDRTTDYDRDVIHAINMGAKSYEALNMTAGEEIPPNFVANIIGDSESNSNLGMAIVEDMMQARERFFDTHHELALGVQAVCAAHSSPELASVYGVGGAALVRSVHEEVYQIWQFEEQLKNLDLDLD